MISGTRRRRRQKGQVEILSTSIAGAIFASLLGMISYMSWESRETEHANATAHSYSIMADAAAKYVGDNYGLISHSIQPGNVRIIAASCISANTQCTFSSGTGPSGQIGLVQAGYLPPGTTNTNMYGQQYLVAITSDANGNLNAILTTSGPTINDVDNAAIAGDTGMLSGYIPITAIQNHFTSPQWALDFGLWGGAVTPGHVVISLTPTISNAINGLGGLQRNGSSTDTRPQTMHRPMYLGRNDVTGQNANICFCPTPYNGGPSAYTGPCAISNTDPSPIKNPQNTATPTQACSIVPY